MRQRKNVERLIESMSKPLETDTERESFLDEGDNETRSMYFAEKEYIQKNFKERTSTLMRNISSSPIDTFSNKVTVQKWITQLQEARQVYCNSLYDVLEMCIEIQSEAVSPAASSAPSNENACPGPLQLSNSEMSKPSPVKLQPRRNHPGVRNTKSNRASFSEYTTNILNKWFYDNFHDPYPDARQKEILADEAGVTYEQVSDWIDRGTLKTRVWCKEWTYCLNSRMLPLHSYSFLPLVLPVRRWECGL